MHEFLTGRLAGVAAVAAGIVATLVLVLPDYAQRPFWFDELVSLEAAGLSPAELARYVFGQEANMALYHLTLSAWLGIAEGEAAVRALSVAFAILTLPFLYALTRRLYDRRTAVTAVLLMSVNVTFVGYSRDARAYALALLLVTASSHFLVRASERPRRVDWILYLSTAVLAVWAHLFAALVVLAQLAWLWWVRRGGERRSVILVSAAIAALLLPLALAILVGDQRAQLDWLERPGPQKIPGLFQWFVESKVTVVVYLVGGVAALGSAVAGRRRDRSHPIHREAFLLLWLLLPPAIAFIASYATPLYLYRYFLVCLPALVVLVAAGFQRLPPAWLGVPLTLVALLLSVHTVYECQPDCKIRHDDWQAAATYLNERAGPGDAIVVYPAQVRTGVHAHLSAERPDLLFPERWELRGAAAVGAHDLSRAMRSVPGYRRVWLVTWWLPANAARNALARRAEPRSRREFQGNIGVELYRVRGGDP